MGGVRDGGTSFWWQQLGLPAAGQRRAPLPPSSSPLECDVAVVGGGYTGLWTAYYLKRADPSLRVVVLEREFAGCGASGRNGGWLTNEITGGVEGYRRSHGAAAVDAFQLAVDETVQEVVRVAAAGVGLLRRADHRCGPVAAGQNAGLPATAASCDH